MNIQKQHYSTQLPSPRLGIVMLLLLLVCNPIQASYLYQSSPDEIEVYYYDSYQSAYYSAYESAVYEPFIDASVDLDGSDAHLSRIRGRQNAIGNPSEPKPNPEFPVGEPWIMFIFAAIAAGVIYIRRKNMKHNTRKSLLTLLILLAATSNAWSYEEYRLLYVEQEVVDDEYGFSQVNITYSHPSDIIAKKDSRILYSLHIYNKMDGSKDVYGNLKVAINNPAILVQGRNTVGSGEWQTIERHMACAPLHSDFGMLNMPGRRKSVGIDYGDGIENIKNDLKNIKAYQEDNSQFYIGDVDNYDEYAENFANDSCSGVWNFVVNRDENGNIDESKPLLLEKTHRYQGPLYARTPAAEGGWDNYTSGKNTMTRSNISQDNSNYSHYFCRDVNSGTSVKYVLANDYAAVLSKTLTKDETNLWGEALAAGQEMVTDGTLPYNASVRFSWNEKTNLIHRAYIHADARAAFLTLRDEAENYFDFKNHGNTGWIYHSDTLMQSHKKLRFTATYNDKTQYFIGTSDPTDGIQVLYGETNGVNHPVRIFYDFKINEVWCAYVPRNNNDTTDIEPIKTSLMLVRKENNKPTQLMFNNNWMDEVGQYAYGVLELSKGYLSDTTLSPDVRSFYWISFPFDVDLSQSFGYGEYGTHWIIETYDGKSRAEKGLWADSETFWQYHWEPESVNAGTEDEGILKAGMGYVVAIDLEKINSELSTSSAEAISIYFKSKEPIKKNIVNQSTHTTNVPAYECKIKRPTPHGDRTINDSHWNVIGVPSYANADVAFNSEPIETTVEKTLFYYKWDGATNTYAVEASNPTSFQSMHAYMVQYAGELVWTSVVNEGPASLAARKDANSTIERKLRLELQHDGNSLDRTFITLQEDDVTAGFDFNYDLCKIINAGSNIYSIITTGDLKTNAAGNILPLEENTTIPLGVVAGEAGEYTFAMPDGTDGIVVELIDYETNTTTNLLFGDYTVELPKGTFENRFALFVRPDKTATSVEDIVGEAVKNGETARKYIIDGKLYLQKGNVLYDAQGKRL